MIFKRLWKHLSRRRRKQFILTLFLMISASLLEVMSIGAVLPFIGVLISPEKVFEYQFIQPLIRYLALSEPKEIILPITVLFVFAAIIAGIVRLALMYVMIRLSYAVGADFSIGIYKRTLYQEYDIHISRNSSEVIDGIITKTNIVIRGILSPSLMLISSLILMFGIVSALLIINFMIATSAFICFGFLYLIVIKYTRKKVKINSQCVADQSSLMVKAIQEGLGGIRDVLINGSQEFFCKLYRKSDLPMRLALGDNAFIAGSPRYIMESLGMAFIAIFAYIIIKQDNSIDQTIPVLGALALGAQRLLPCLQQAYSSYSSIMSAQASFVDVLRLLDQPYRIQNNKFNPPIKFQEKIELREVAFRYGKLNPLVLKNINLVFLKGSCIGFIGATGSGKSTLLDIIMGLLSPTEGYISIDGTIINKQNKSFWQDKIAHVPQSIYLSDGSVESNIAFGVAKNKVDIERVKKAAERAQISNIIESWEQGYNTKIGEHGVKISGGQRQRIGIARALYKDVDVLIFDEATSALDNETERSVMESIEVLKNELTILIIAHRLTTLQQCDQVIELDQGMIIKKGSYKEIINEN